MNGLCRHPLRVTGRFLWFVGVVLAAVFDFLLHNAFRPEKSTPAARALWVQRHSRRVLKIFKLEPRVAGPVPTRGLLVSNHLGYLDILVLASITPAVFVSKREIKSWPVVGWLAQMGGTLFVNRERRVQVGRVNDEIQAALNQGALVVLFPEGTSSNGQTVLPFKSSLLEPAAQSSASALGRRDSIRHRRRRRGAEMSVTGATTPFFRICSICWASAPSAPPSVLRRFNGPARTASNWRCNCARRF